MDFFGNRRKLYVFVLISLCLFAFVLWQYLLGGRSSIQMTMVPVNEQMQALIDQSVEHAAVSTAITPPRAKEPEPEPSSPSLSPAPKGLPSAPPASNADSTPSAHGDDSRLDLNTATKEQLDSLPGIGASKAKAILEYRLKIGRFNSVEQLTEVKGIGDKMLEKLKPLVYVAAP